MIPQSNPGASYLAQRADIDSAIQEVLASGWYILGGQVSTFEREFASYIGVPHMLGVANGTDAITLALKSLGIGPGDAVATVSHTAVASIVGIQLSGATPVLLDIDEFYTLDPEQLKGAATVAEAHNLRLAAVLPVHLYGQSADLDRIAAFSRAIGGVIIEDCAQAHGAVWNGKMLGSIGDAASFSFYPTKNLGAFGDGGATAFRDSDVMTRANQLRQYGWDADRRCQQHGMNSRLDELQAAILRAKLTRLAADIERRRAIAAAYNDGLRDLPILLPEVREGCVHAWHQYVVSVSDREAFRNAMTTAGIGTAIHYTPPNHLHPVYRNALRAGALTRTEVACERIVSLPMFSELTDPQVNRVIDAIRAACR
jgi:dTDP-4-amino-4,6-dideoxygalactose transaminase